jgi:hypothetical protein
MAEENKNQEFDPTKLMGAGKELLAEHPGLLEEAEELAKDRPLLNDALKNIKLIIMGVEKRGKIDSDDKKIIDDFHTLVTIAQKYGTLPQPGDIPLTQTAAHGEPTAPDNYYYMYNWGQYDGLRYNAAEPPAKDIDTPLKEDTQS